VFEMHGFSLFGFRGFLSSRPFLLFRPAHILFAPISSGASVPGFPGKHQSTGHKADGRSKMRRVGQKDRVAIIRFSKDSRSILTAQ
jgi:hypothetical protein